MSYAAETKLRVIAVDDEPEILDAIRELLKDHGKLELVGTGANGRDALQLANRLKPDVVLLDVKMPVLNGLEAAARVRSCFPDIVVVMLTSETDAETVREAMRVGVAEYLSKVSSLGQLPKFILEAHARRTKPTHSKGDAFFWGFYPTKGSAGATTLAVNAAVYLAMLNYRVLLMDLDSVNGDCAFQLNLPPRPATENLLYLLGQLPEFDPTMIEKCTRRMSVSDRPDSRPLSLLDSPGTFVLPGAHLEDNFKVLLEFVLKEYDYVLVDFGPGRVSEWMTAAVLDLAERLFVVTTRDMSAVKALTVLTTLMKESAFPVGKVSVLLSPLCDQLNFKATELVSTNKMQVREVLEVTLDRAGCSDAIRAGKPLLIQNENAPLARYVKHLVEGALNLPPGGGRQDPSVWSRLVGNFRRVLGFDGAGS